MYLLLHSLGPQNFPQTGVMQPEVLHCTAVNPIRPGLFGSIGTRGGQICPHPIKTGVMGGGLKN